VTVDLAPLQARRLAVLLADRIAADRAQGPDPDWMTAENLELLARLQPACRWDDAGVIGRAIGMSAMAAAGLPP
jgi:hypothetical protein